MQIKRQYIVDESNCKAAVQLDIETFVKIEETLENYGLIRDSFLSFPTVLNKLVFVLSASVPMKEKITVG